MTWFRPCAAVIAALAMLGCAETQYRPYGDNDSTAADPLVARQVFYKVEQSFYDTPPECVVVLMPEGPRDAAVLLEEAIARHLTGRIRRVIGPGQRRRDERHLAFDTDDESDLRRYAQAIKCPTLLRSRITEAENGSALVWSGRRFGASLELVNADSDIVLWRAAHSTNRSEGGVPLSPLSFPSNIFAALRFQQDVDQLPSMVEDAVRRMVVTLPDIK